jgi:hypothetical protein
MVNVFADGAYEQAVPFLYLFLLSGLSLFDIPS